MNTPTKPDLFELVKSLKGSGFLYAKRDYPHDKTDSPLFSLYGDRITSLYLNAVIDFEIRRKDWKYSFPLCTVQLYFRFHLTIRCALGIYKSARCARRTKRTPKAIKRKKQIKRRRKARLAADPLGKAFALFSSAQCFIVMLVYPLIAFPHLRSDLR